MKFLPFHVHVSEAWKNYPFWTEPLVQAIIGSTPPPLQSFSQLSLLPPLAYRAPYSRFNIQDSLFCTTYGTLQDITISVMFLVLSSLCNFMAGVNLWVFCFVLFCIFFPGGLVLSSAAVGSASYILSPQDQIDFGDYMGMSCYIWNTKDHVWPLFQTPRLWLKIQLIAQYFWRT